ncbi:MAG: hypothetical protein AAFO07_31845 [Bacteroidota bacterium]
MTAQSVPELVKSNPKNEGFWKFEDQEKENVKIKKWNLATLKVPA